MPDGLGLYLRLYSGGTKSFEVRAFHEGKRSWILIGRWPGVSLKRARILAGAAKLKLETGWSIEALRRALRAGDGLELMASPAARPLPACLSFKQMAEIWFDRKRVGLRIAKHAAQNWTTVETYLFPFFGRKSVAEVTTNDVIEAICPIWHSKTETAKRVLGRAQEIFELAKIQAHRSDNPADFRARIAFGPVRRVRGHFGALPYEKMPELWDWAIAVGCDETIRQLMMMMMLTAKRSGESRFAAWSYFDESARIWTAPAELMKMGRQHRVPLSRQAMVVLDNARLLSGDRALVFARPNCKSGAASENTVCKLLKRFDPQITAHGFRASFRTWARQQKKYSLDAMEFALAHEQDDLEAAYQREDLIEERAILMQDWADFLTGGREPVSLRKLIEEA